MMPFRFEVTVYAPSLAHAYGELADLGFNTGDEKQVKYVV